MYLGLSFTTETNGDYSKNGCGTELSPSRGFLALLCLYLNGINNLYFVFDKKNIWR